MIYTGYFHSPIGYIRVQVTESEVCSIDFISDEEVVVSASQHHPLVKQALNQLAEYFRGERRAFSLPLQEPATNFQKQVLTRVSRIPYAQTHSYKDIAVQIGNEKASRAVGNVNRQNRVLIVVPCHRVVGSNQSLTGYAGGLWRKEWLLQHEQETLKNAMMHT